ncbi:MAG: TRCF domain-containing protein, partial [Pseudomonadota bacterium]
ETITALKGGNEGGEDQWSPEIAIGVPTLIPESYVADLQLRLGLYRRLSNLETRADIDDFAAELADRFGPVPDEVKGLLDVMEIKALCRKAGVQKIDAGPKGAVFTFREGELASPDAVLKFIQKAGPKAKLQPDNKLVYKAGWDDGDRRLKGVTRVLGEMTGASAKAQADAAAPSA